MADPYPVYQRLQAEGPLWLDGGGPASGTWLFTRYTDVEQILRDSRLTKDPRVHLPSSPVPTQEQAVPHMLLLDPPDHTRLRGLVSSAFTPRVVGQLRQHVTDVVRHLIGRHRDVGEMDLMADLALPLPVIVIAELLGVPEHDRELFCDWSNSIVDSDDPISGATAEAEARADAAEGALTSYFQKLTMIRRGHPQDDLISRLIAAETHDGRLTEAELISTCVLLLIAGHETTVNLIGNGTLALLAHPADLDRLGADTTLLGTAVDELLRYDSPVQQAGYRAALHDVQIGGVVVRAGQQVSAVIGAANRDPAEFPQPHRLDLSRSPNRHLSFGRGIHFCLGASLARLEAEVAFEHILSDLPRLRLEGAPVRRSSTKFRGLKTLPVSFD